MNMMSIRQFVCGLVMLFGPLTAVAAAGVAGPDSPGEVLTNTSSLRRLTLGPDQVSCAFRLEGTVLWVSSEQSEFILQDSSGGIRVQCDLREEPHVRPGDRVRVSGRAIAGPGGLRQLLIDNDGRHAPAELSESIYLSAGRYPIRVDYFNGPAGFELSLEYQGPNIPRQRVPDTACFRFPRGPEDADHADAGLDYRCYEGNWQVLPDFSQLEAVKTGTVSNLDLSVRSRDQLVGLLFTGYVEIPCDGVFTFWLKSDDGSRLYLGGGSIEITKLGTDTLPTPRPIAAGMVMSEEGFWAEAGGILLALDPAPGGGMEALLGGGGPPLHVHVADGTGNAPLLFSIVRAIGIAFSSTSSGASRLADRLLVPDFHHLELLKSAAENLIAPAPITISQTRTLAAAGGCDPGNIRLQGVVLTVDRTASLLTLADASGVALLHLNLQDWNLRVGQRIAVSGNCLVDGAQFNFRPVPLVDNDGVHTLAAKSAAVFLTSGLHPIHVYWFHDESPEALDIFWQSPGRLREKLPAAALLHAASSRDGAIQWLPGLEYKAYEGHWLQAPNPLRLEPLKQAITPNFETSLATRPQNAALEFSGYLAVTNAGVYNLTSISDDGCLLFLDAAPTRIEVLGEGAVPDPVGVVPRQILSVDRSHRWAKVEGRVTFASRHAGSLTLELTAGTGHMLVEVADAAGASPLLLLNSLIRVTGICQADYTPDGQRVAGSLLAASVNQLEYLEMAPAHWTDYPATPIARLAESTVREDSDTIVHVQGRIVAQAEDGALVLEDESGQVQLQTVQSPPESDSLDVEALGRLGREGTNSVLRCAFYRDLDGRTDEPSPPLRLLTTIEQVKRLTRREAQRSFPVRIRGVVTTALNGGCFVQDATWAVYVLWQNTIKGDPPRVGEYWEIEGVTFALFAPNIRARRAVKLGTGVMPDPLRPTWDQLINGSLDTRYVEIQGVVTGVEPDELALLTRDGRIKVQLLEVPPQNLKQYQNAVVRLRGCLIPEKDVNDRKVELGRISLSNFSITVDEAPPADPFALPLKKIGELLLFDPRASSIHRVKIAGQILHERHGEYFLAENDAGLRFFLHHHVALRPGDLVEVVGFPDLSGPSPILRESLVRCVGNAALPAPLTLSGTNLLSRRFDARLVRLEARLANLSFNRSDQVLALETGGRGFVARLDTSRGELPDLAPGTRVELSGVYAGQGSDVASGGDLGSFELLLNSAADLRILQRPSWWTGQHALMVVGAMALSMLAALVWIKQLQRQVEDRSQLLAAEVRRHEQTERQRALEQERARISRDLHDDLGSTLTQIRFLSALESRDNLVPVATRSRMSQVTEKSRQMVASLDEIVWAVNPANDSLLSLATYLCQFAEEFFRPTPIRCRLDVPDSLPELPLTSEVRHNLYLAVREALNNIAKHSEATEVWLRIQVHEHVLHIALEDNGRGFSFPAEAFAGDGLGNMRTRLERLGGRFECQTQNGSGTICRISLPLNYQLTNYSKI